ncbi:hypothetical protein V8G54_027003 [Vigna mungo]|uniref:Uncharacterized protein n=1 Tax=Vigna mungo TaxID=3915 RepID=A0AAQ3RQF1_VIGMU
MLLYVKYNLQFELREKSREEKGGTYDPECPRNLNAKTNKSRKSIVGGEKEVEDIDEGEELSLQDDLSDTNGEKQCRALVDYMKSRSGSFYKLEILADFAGIQRFVIGFHQ